jgi:hypothetical protein
MAGLEHGPLDHDVRDTVEELTRQTTMEKVD